MKARDYAPDISPVSAPAQSPETVAMRTRQLLDGRGWCLWQCSALGDDAIVVARDETVKGFPAGLPVYTEAELEEISQAADSTIHLVHEAKKLTLPASGEQASLL